MNEKNLTMQGLDAHSLILTRHVWPVQPAAQVQLNVPWEFVHTPPFWHGELEQ